MKFSSLSSVPLGSYWDSTLK